MAKRVTSTTVNRGCALFWTQIGVGALAGLGTVAGLGAVGAAGRAWPVAALLVVAWLIATVVILVALERRKASTSTAPPDTGWTHRVRELRASRLEIVTAFEIERRRIERDLHDGTQQHLVVASLRAGEAGHLMDAHTDGTSRQVSDLLAQAQDAIEEALAALRVTVAGIHPTVLSDLGLAAAVHDLAARSAGDVTVRVPNPLPLVPDAVAAAVYFLVAEALTNVAKHAPEARTTVLLAADEQLHVSIVDDGPGGAEIKPAHGLAGMTERLSAFGGVLALTSPAGGPTALNARLPLLLAENQPSVDLPPTTKAHP